MSSRLRGFPSRGPERAAELNADTRQRLRTVERRLARTGSAQSVSVIETSQVNLKDSSVNVDTASCFIEVPETNPFVNITYSVTLSRAAGTACAVYVQIWSDQDFQDQWDSAGSGLQDYLPAGAMEASAFPFADITQTYRGGNATSAAGLINTYTTYSATSQVLPGTREFYMRVARQAGSYATYRTFQRNLHVALA